MVFVSFSFRFCLDFGALGTMKVAIPFESEFKINTSPKSEKKWIPDSILGSFWMPLASISAPRDHFLWFLDVVVVEEAVEKVIEKRSKSDLQGGGQGRRQGRHPL